MTHPIEASNGRPKVVVAHVEEIEQLRTEEADLPCGVVLVAASPETRTSGENVAQALEWLHYQPRLLVVTAESLPEAVTQPGAEEIVGYVEMACGTLADERLGGQNGLLTGRLEFAIRSALPTVAAPGGMDIVHFGTRETVPIKYSRRKLLPEDPNHTRMRTDVIDNARMGRELADLLNRFPQHLAVCLPLRGLSELSAPDGPFWGREADVALFGNLITHLRREIPLYEANANINDPAFAELCAHTLHDLITIVQAQ